MRDAHLVVMKFDPITRCVEREEARASFLAAGLAAWELFQSTGLHLSQGEVDGWLAHLEAGEQMPAPESHN